MSLLDWLLDSDPSLRWQALRDLADSPAEVAAAERARVATEGWGARLLALQGKTDSGREARYSPRCAVIPATASPGPPLQSPAAA